MASTLQQKMNEPKKKTRRDPTTGQLVEAEGQVQTLSESLNRPVDPVSPQGGAAIGASEDAAKMLGTKQQKDAALGQAVDPTRQGARQTLQTARRQEQGRQVASEGEQATMQALETLEGLAGSSERVKSQVATTIQELGQQHQPELDQEGIEEAGLTPEEQEALTIIQSGDLEGGVAAFNEGKADTELATTEQIMGFFESPEAALDQIMKSEELASQIRVDEAFLDGVGVDAQELEDLGITLTDDMTITQFYEAVNDRIEEEYTRVEELERLANDPMLSPAQRAEARQELRALGAVGVEEAERDIQEIDEALATAGEFTIGDETYTIEELLADETISGLISEVVANPDGDMAQSLRESEFAGLLDFTENNREALASLTEGLDTTNQEFKEIQEHNAALSTIPGTDDSMSDEVMSLLYGDSYGQFNTNKLPPLGFMTALKDINDGEFSREFVNALESAAKSGDRALFDELSSLRPSSIRNIQKAGGMKVYNKKKEINEALERGDMNAVVDALDIRIDPQDTLDAHRQAKVFGYRHNPEAVNLARLLINPEAFRNSDYFKSLNPFGEDPLPSFKGVKDSVEIRTPEGFDSAEEYDKFIEPLKEYAKDGIIDNSEFKKALHSMVVNPDGSRVQLVPEGMIEKFRAIPGLSKSVHRYLDDSEKRHQELREQRIRAREEKKSRPQSITNPNHAILYQNWE